MAFAGSIVMDIGLNVARIQRDVSSALGSIKSFERGISSLKSGLLGLAGAGSAFELIKKTIVDTAQRGEDLNRLSQKLGMTVQQLSAMQGAAKLTDVAFEDMVNGVKFFEKALGGMNEEGADTTKLLKALGVSAKDPHQAMLQLADAFEGMKDGAGKVKVSLELLGRGGLAMIPYLNEGSAGIKKMTEELQKMGVVMTKDQADAGARFNDNLKAMQLNLLGFTQTIGNVAIPKINELFDLLNGKKDQDLMIGSLIEQRQGLENRIKQMGKPVDPFWIAALESMKKELDIVNRQIDSMMAKFKTVVTPTLPKQKKDAPFIPDQKKIDAAAEAMKRLTNAQMAYTDSVSKMDPALSDYQKSLMSWTDQYEKMVKAIDDEDKITKSQKETLKAQAKAQYEQGKAFMESAHDAKELGASLQGLKDYQDRWTEAINRNNRALVVADEHYRETGTALANVFQEAGDLVPKFGESDLEFIRRQIEARKQLIPWMEKMIAELEKTGDTGSDAYKELTRGIQEYNNSLAAASDSFGLGWDQGIKEFTDRTKWGFERGKEIINDFAMAAESALIEMWDDPKKAIDDFGKYLLNQLKKWAAEALLNPIIIQLKGAFTGAGASAAGASSLLGGAFSGGNILGSVGSMAGGSLMGAGIGSLIGGTNSTIGGLVGGLAGNALFTTTIASSLWSTALGGSVMNALGAAFGSAVPVIGSIVGGLLGSVMGSLFGGKKRPPELIFGYQPGEYSRAAGPYHADEYAGGVAKGMSGAWDIAGIRIEYREQGELLAKDFIKATDAMMSAMQKLGMDISGFSNKFLKDIHLEGLSDEQVKEQITNMLTDALKGFVGPQVTGVIDSLKKESEDFASAFARIMDAFQAMPKEMENVEILMRAIEGNYTALQQWQDQIGAATKNIDDLQQKMKEATDPSDVLAYEQELKQAIVSRYQMEIEYVQALKNEIDRLGQEIRATQRAMASFNVEMTSRIDQLTGSSNTIPLLQSYKSPFLSQYGAATTADEKLDIINTGIAAVDKWLSATIDSIQSQYRGWETVIKGNEDVIEAQKDTLTAWHDLAESVHETIIKLSTSTANPASAVQRLAIQKQEVARIKALYESATGQEKITYGEQLTDAITEELQLGQEVYQRPSLKYQALYAEAMTDLLDVQETANNISENYQDKMERLTASIVEDVRITGDNTSAMNSAINAANAEAARYYQWLKTEGLAAYAQKITEDQIALAKAEQQFNAITGALGYNGWLLATQNETNTQLSILNTTMWNFYSAFSASIGATNAAATQGTGVRHLASGISYVPNDMLAFIHKGERVMTASENAQYSGGKTSIVVSPTINVTVEGESDPSMIAKEVERIVVASAQSGRLRTELLKVKRYG